jgi:hypothetical protein
VGRVRANPRSPQSSASYENNSRLRIRIRSNHRASALTFAPRLLARLIFLTALRFKAYRRQAGRRAAEARDERREASPTGRSRGPHRIPQIEEVADKPQGAAEPGAAARVPAESGSGAPTIRTLHSHNKENPSSSVRQQKVTVVGNPRNGPSVIFHNTLISNSQQSKSQSAALWHFGCFTPRRVEGGASRHQLSVEERE